MAITNIQLQNRISGLLKKKPTIPFSPIIKPKISTSPSSKYYQSKKASQSSADLYKLAVKSGFQKDADKILKSQAGEETKKIFSGGFISDVFDSLSALQYGVTGVIKGKGFIEGVKTRQSFSDKDALGDKGLPGVIAGIALDIAVDPLTYVAPWTIAKKVPIISKLAKAGKTAVFGKMVEKTIETAEGIKKFQQLEGGTKLGKYLGDKFSWMFGVDPVYRQSWEKTIKNIGQSTQNVADIAKKLVDLPADTAKKLLTKDTTGRFKRIKLEDLKKVLTPEELSIVTKAWSKIDDLGKEAVDLGLLSKEKFEENLGEYIKNAYTEYEQAEGKGIFGFLKTGVKGIKSRKTPEELAGGFLKSLDINEVKKLYPKAISTTGKITLKNFSEEEILNISKKSLESLGQIDNPAYLLFKGSFDLIKDIENTKLFNATAKTFASDVMQEGFKQLPKGQRLGELAGKFVPENIFNHIQDIIEPFKDTLGKKLVATFKYNKVILNPATHARNIMSNTILNWWKMGLGPWRADIYAEAVSQVAKGGKWVDEAKTVGYNLNTFASNELKGLLDSPEARPFLKGLGGYVNKLKNKLGDIYQGEENIAKLAGFIFQRKKGVDIENAWKAAESATFDYAQVTPFIRKLRTSLFGMPFVTFAIKAAPVAVETALKHPARISVFGKVKNAIEQLSDIKETEKERASEPPWIKDGFYIKLPIKDKLGRSAYFDLTYIIPFGDLISGSFFERQIKRETGLKESVPEAVLSNFPVIQLIKELTKNQDFYGDKLWNDSDTTEKQLGDLMRHLTKTLMPPLVADQIPGGYKTDGERRQKGIIGVKTASAENQQRTLMQEMLRNVGAKIQPIDADIQESMQEWNTKKALQNMLIENQVLKQFNITYQPK